MPKQEWNDVITLTSWLTERWRANQCISNHSEGNSHIRSSKWIKQTMGTDRLYLYCPRIVIKIPSTTRLETKFQSRLMVLVWKLQQAPWLYILRSKSEWGLKFILSAERTVTSYGSYSCPIFCFQIQFLLWNILHYSLKGQNHFSLSAGGISSCRKVHSAFLLQ